MQRWGGGGLEAEVVGMRLWDTSAEQSQPARDRRARETLGRGTTGGGEMVNWKKGVYA